MKIFLAFLCAALLFSNLYLWMELRLEKMKNENFQNQISRSVGEQTGEMVKQAHTQLQQSYLGVNLQAQKASQELTQTAKETLAVLQEESKKSAVNLDQVWRDFIQLVNQELQKFKTTLQKPSP